MKWLLVFFCVLSSLLSASSIRLYNDSPYKLRAVVRAADGTYLGELILLPQTFSTWTDSYSQYGALGSKGPVVGSTRSQTPYTVQWYCISGDDFSICTNVATGATVLAQSCDGNRQCKPKPVLPGEPRENNPEGEHLDNQNSVPYNPYLPDSPYNPNNPNNPYSPQSPYNPANPYNPDNPNSPYNPRNPKSPYYRSPNGATGVTGSD